MVEVPKYPKLQPVLDTSAFDDDVKSLSFLTKKQIAKRLTDDRQKIRTGRNRSGRPLTADELTATKKRILDAENLKTAAYATASQASSTAPSTSDSLRGLPVGPEAVKKAQDAVVFAQLSGIIKSVPPPFIQEFVAGRAVDFKFVRTLPRVGFSQPLGVGHPLSVQPKFLYVGDEVWHYVPVKEGEKVTLGRVTRSVRAPPEFEDPAIATRSERMEFVTEEQREFEAASQEGTSRADTSVESSAATYYQDQAAEEEEVDPDAYDPTRPDAYGRDKPYYVSGSQDTDKALNMAKAHQQRAERERQANELIKASRDTSVASLAEGVERMSPPSTEPATAHPAETEMDVDMTLESPSALPTVATPQGISPSGPKGSPLTPVGQGITLSEFDDPNPPKKTDHFGDWGTEVDDEEAAAMAAAQEAAKQAAAVTTSQASAHQAAADVTAQASTVQPMEEDISPEEVRQLLDEEADRLLASDDEAEADKAKPDDSEEEEADSAGAKKAKEDKAKKFYGQS